MVLARHPRGPKQNPWNVLEDLNRSLGQMFGRRDDNGESSGLSLGQWTPKTDVYEEDDRRIVELEAPGLDRSDFDISYEDGVLTITGTQTDERQESGRNYLRAERMQGQFQRSFRVGEDIDPEEIHASYQDGILKLELPNNEPAESKRIPIE